MPDTNYISFDQMARLRDSSNTGFDFTSPTQLFSNPTNDPQQTQWQANITRSLQSKYYEDSLLLPPQQDLLGSLAGRLGAGGAPWLETSPTGIVDRWRTGVAEPLMDVWNQIGAPAAKEAFNIPGGFYSGARGRGVQRAGEDFIMQRIAPQLFTSYENQLSRLTGLAGGLATGTTTENIVQQEPDTTGQFAQIAGSIAMAMMMSDRRSKRDIAELDHSELSAVEKVKRLKGYSYKYLDDDEPQIGIMAQDVEKVIPDGVIEIDGKKHVKIPAVLALLVDAINELGKEVA